MLKFIKEIKPGPLGWVTLPSRNYSGERPAGLLLSGRGGLAQPFRSGPLFSVCVCQAPKVCSQERNWV